jgi:secreted PhoX family phosphatase
MVLYLPGVNTPVRRRTPSAAALGFDSIPLSTADRIEVADGYSVDVLLKWGDPLLAGAPPFDPTRQSAGAQALQFGYNADFVGFLPLPRGGTSSHHGLLVVNHEYTNPELMFADYDPLAPTRPQVDVQLAAHGMSILEVRCDETGWAIVPDSPYARRITGFSPMLVTGPAAGHHLLQTDADPSGRHVLGTLANCSAGRTPWGTILSGEENWHLYFANRDAIMTEGVLRVHARYGMIREATSFGFERYYERFDMGVEPHEPFRFGWVVEVDPFDPTWTPRKRTALGRFRREGAACTVATDGQLVLYSADDIVFEYIYKFVTDGRVDAGDRSRNRDLLDEGTLYVARFAPDGTGLWIPLVYGTGPFVEENGFLSQADVVAKTLQAADLAHGTRMDRPEDIRVSPTSGTLYVTLTNNSLRGGDGYLRPDPANPRPLNHHGHILEIRELLGDHAAGRFEWDIFILCGDPDDPDTYFAGFAKDGVSAISCPDNLTFDRMGNLWVATDGQPRTLAANDALYAVPVTGPERGRVRRFLSSVPGSEVCSPEFTPDNRSLFLSVQHPGEGSALPDTTSRWPDGTIPRPGVVVVQASDGRPIGTNSAP